RRHRARRGRADRRGGDVTAALARRRTPTTPGQKTAQEAGGAPGGEAAQDGHNAPASLITVTVTVTVTEVETETGLVELFGERGVARATAQPPQQQRPPFTSPRAGGAAATCRGSPPGAEGAATERASRRLSSNATTRLPYRHACGRGVSWHAT